jgi:hypothetical protein
MTGINQEILEYGRGDCLRACVASVLDLPIHEVPNFHPDLEFNEWTSRECDLCVGRGSIWAGSPNWNPSMKTIRSYAHCNNCKGKGRIQDVDQYGMLERWLNARGKTFIQVTLFDEDPKYYTFTRHHPFAIASGLSPRANGNPSHHHAVVVRTDEWVPVLAWDPHPTDKCGVVGPYKKLTWIIPLP